MSFETQIFNHAVRELVGNLFDEYVKMPSLEQEQISETKGFIKNYEFTCIGARDNFHVYACSKLKNHYNLKHRYTTSNQRYNKRFLNLTVGTPGSAHDARFLRNVHILKQILKGQGLPDKTVDFGYEYGKVPLITTGDSLFSRFSWLLKNFNCNTNDERERYYIKNLNSARVVRESCYGMCKSRWQILSKKQNQRFSILKAHSKV